MSDIQSVGQQISKLASASNVSAAQIQHLIKWLKQSSAMVQSLIQNTSQHGYQEVMNHFSVAQRKLADAAASLMMAANSADSWIANHVGGTSMTGNTGGPCANGTDGPAGKARMLSPAEVTERWKATIANTDEQINNYREALHSRGVPEGRWLDQLLKTHRAAMLEQEAYFLDVASGHKDDTTNRENAYQYPGDYKAFYNELAGQFRTFCAKSTNPNYNPKEINEWFINCQRCVPTYEMLRRGEIVTAQPNPGGYDHLSSAPFSVWKNAQVITCTEDGHNEIEAQMAKWGDGARAQIVVMWSEHEGHTFVAEQINGKTHYIDPQSDNEAYNDWVYSAVPGRTQFCRIDNLEFSDDIKDCFKKVGG